MKTNTKQLYGIFSDVFPPMMDGVSLTVKNYADWIHKKEEAVCVVTPNDPSYKDQELYNVYRYFSLPIPMRKPYRMGIAGIDFSFHTKMNQLPFALLHAHSPFSSGKVALHLAKKRRIPLIATFHSKYRSDFERIIPSKTIINIIIKNIVEFYEQADEVWIPQASVEEPLREYGYRGRVEVVENGNDFFCNDLIDPLRCMARNNLLLREGEFMFLFVGQHIWEKNVELIIRSLSLLNDIPFKMFFVGSGYAEQKMRDMVEDLGLENNVVFTGIVKDRNRLKEYYAAADLFLFPSLYDNAPLVVREAAALHTPSLLLEHSTAAEIIRHNENGFLAAHSPEAFAAHIRYITGNPKLLETVGLKASQTIARPWEDIIGEVLDRYKKLTKR